MFEFLSNNPDFALSVFTLVVTIIVTVFSFIAKQWLNKKNIDETVYNAVFAGVGQSYDAFVRDLKKSAEDKKLTKDEIKQAQKIMTDTAVKYAKVHGVDIIKTHGLPYIISLAESIISKKKSDSVS